MKKGLLKKVMDTDLGILVVSVLPSFVAFKIIDIDKIQTKMNTLTTGEMARWLISFSVGFIIYIYFKGRLLKKQIIKYIKNSKEEAIEFNMMLDTIQSRKNKYTMEYIEAMEKNTDRPFSNDTSWLTPLEEMFYKDSIKKRNKILNKIKKEG